MNFFSRVIVLAIGWLAAVGSLRAEDSGLRASKPEVRRAIVAVVEEQLAAFRAGDGRKAYSYASSALRLQKPLRAFLAIVQESYPEIWTNTRGEIGVVRDDGEQATLLVHVFGQDGDAAYDYTLVHERSGWRIAAVLRHAPRMSDKV